MAFPIKERTACSKSWECKKKKSVITAGGRRDQTSAIKSEGGILSKC